MLTLNINQVVQVVLTVDGQRVLDGSEFKNEWRRWIKGGDGGGNIRIRIETQLWHLLAAFGPHSHVGALPYFVNNDIIIVGAIRDSR